MEVAARPQVSIEQNKKIIEIHNPITSELLGKIEVTTAEGVREAYERAKSIQATWEAVGVKGRANLLRKWATLLWDDQAEIIRRIRNETGKTEGNALLECIGVEQVVQYYQHHAHKILKPQARRTLFPGIEASKVYYKPHGVVGVISPWNYPFLLPFMDVVPALIAGNTVILKPSEVTPLIAEYATQKMYEAGVPQDVFQLVQGDGATTGSALVGLVDYVHFTGSTTTGRKIGIRCAERLIPYSLELGGKDASIVLNDANVDMTATLLIRGAYENAGQACVAIERVYVEAGIYEPLIESILRYMDKMQTGAGAGMDVHMGSLTNERELLRTEEHIQDALNKGAKLLYGGKRRPDLGPLFYEATILTDVTHEMKVMQEETFGPLMPIMKVKDVQEAIDLTNDSEYGLSSSIFSKDLSQAARYATQLDTGDVSVNRTHTVIGTPDVPSGGQRHSGMGRRNGPEGLIKYTALQTILTDNMLGQKPGLALADPITLKILMFFVKLRRWISWI